MNSLLALVISCQKTQLIHLDDDLGLFENLKSWSSKFFEELKWSRIDKDTLLWSVISVGITSSLRRPMNRIVVWCIMHRYSTEAGMNKTNWWIIYNITKPKHLFELLSTEKEQSIEKDDFSWNSVALSILTNGFWIIVHNFLLKKYGWHFCKHYWNLGKIF